MGAERDGRQVVVAAFLEHGRLDDGAGGDDAAHGAFDQLLARRRLAAYLLGDGDLVAGRHQPGDVGIDAVVGHAGQRHALVRAHGPGGQHHIADLGHDPGVVVEGLVEVAQAEKEDRVRELFLDRQVLAAHGGCHNDE